MSFSIDVNVLLYASDTASPLSGQASAFLYDCAASDDLLYVAWPTIMGYLRIATHPAIFSAPLTPDEARGNIESLLALPHVRTLGEDEEYWDTYTALSRTLPLRGNAVPDAHLAALLRTHGVRTLYTSDADFRRFPFLRVIDPFSAP